MSRPSPREAPVPGLTPEQLLIIADEFCETHRVRVRSFAALVAGSAVPGARIDGIPVHADTAAAGTALEEAVAALRPLSARNPEFAAVCRAIYRRLGE